MARANGADPESTPLLGNAKPASSWSSRLKAHLNRDISTAHTDLLMLYCYIITGLLDSSAILVWDSFVSMQTGNTIYLGLGLAAPHRSTRWIKAAASVGFFCIGSFLFARWHRWLGQRKRWVMVGNAVLQTLLTGAAALVLMLDNSNPTGGDLRWELFVGIALVAVAASGQAVSSRAVELNMLSTVVLTNIYCDLFSDAKLFGPPTSNKQRNQRAAAAICLLIGAIAGGALGRDTHGIVAALWIAAGMKLLLTVIWLVWKPAEEET